MKTLRHCATNNGRIIAVADFLLIFDPSRFNEKRLVEVKDEIINCIKCLALINEPTDLGRKCCAISFERTSVALLCESVMDCP